MPRRLLLPAGVSLGCIACVGVLHGMLSVSFLPYLKGDLPSSLTSLSSSGPGLFFWPAVEALQSKQNSTLYSAMLTPSISWAEVLRADYTLLCSNPLPAAMVVMSMLGAMRPSQSSLQTGHCKGTEDRHEKSGIQPPLFLSLSTVMYARYGP